MNIQYVTVFVRDMDAAISFFRDCLDLPLKFSSSHWTEFSIEGTTLAIHLTNSPPTSKKSIETAAGTVQIGFNVDNLDDYHKQLIRAGVICLKSPTEVFGSRIAQYEGPEQMVFSVGEKR
jgi:predicted enzyme related to lactoylglutathione lyase